MNWECLQHKVARKIGPISLDVQRRRLNARVGRLFGLQVLYVTGK